MIDMPTTLYESAILLAPYTDMTASRLQRVLEEVVMGMAEQPRAKEGLLAAVAMVESADREDEQEK